VPVKELKYKHSSLFARRFGDEARKFYNIGASQLTVTTKKSPTEEFSAPKKFAKERSRFARSPGANIIKHFTAVSYDFSK
jgi:hypothetical protein